MLYPAFRFLFKILLALLAFPVVYLAASFLLPKIKVNNSFENKEAEVRLFVVSNGVHTDIVLPAVSAYKNWTEQFPKDSFNVHNPALQYIGFGWGDKGFYFDTPEWKDLKFSTAFNAVFGLGSSAMHVRYLREPKVCKGECAELFINAESYQKLIGHIEESLQKKENAAITIQHPGYGKHDRFYEANGTYSLFNTCNIWTNKALKRAGVRVACWSPFAGQLLGSLAP